MLNEVFIVIIDKVSIAIVWIGSYQRRYLFMVDDWDSLDILNQGGVIGTRDRFHLF